MKTMFAFIALAAALPVQSAYAQEATQAPAAIVIKRGAMVYSADGVRIGRVDSVKMDGTTPVTVFIIHNAKLITVPASTLTQGDKKLVSSLNGKDITTH